MSDTLQEMADIPKDFFKDGTAFLNRCTKRTCPYCLLRDTPVSSLLHLHTSHARSERNVRD